MRQTVKEFGKYRSLLWPIHHFELKKLIPMVLLFFLILFNYTILRDTKDTLIVTAAGGGADVIPFIKFWGVLPCAVLFMLIYAKLSNKLSKPALFYTAIIPFLIFFGLFTTVLYPCRDLIHPTILADKLQLILPPGMKGFIAVFRNWTYSLFYIMAELWGSVAISLLFWGFANDTTKISESKRFYSLFGIFANVALIISGQCIRWASKIRQNLPSGSDPWQLSLNYLTGMIILSGIIILGIYWWMNRYVLTDPRFYDSKEQKQKKQEKPKLSIKESFKYLIRSKYLGCITILVMAYGIAINLIEVTWKHQLSLQYPDPNAYSNFMGGFSRTTGIVTILMMLFVGGNMIRRLGWKKAALFTPTTLLLSGVAFFSFIIFRDKLAGVIVTIGTTPLMLAVIFGSMQNIISKAAKYSLFDPTKEMTYIPLDQEQKIKGKAAIDVVGARLGKSGGALVQQFLFVLLGGIGAVSTPYYIGGLLFFIILAWILAVRSLSKQFLSLTSKPSKEDIEQKEIEEKAGESLSQTNSQLKVTN